ncbi:MAG: MFS transporter, partial [Pseudomonadota bacterium]
MTAAEADHLNEDPAPSEVKRNTMLLAGAQAFGSAQASIVIATGGLVGSYLLGADKSLATLPVASFVIGTACGTIPAAMLMRRIGRRSGFIVGAFFGIAGALLSMKAIFDNAFMMFVLGTWLSGVAGAFVQQYRFAAADTAT